MKPNSFLLPQRLALLLGSATLITSPAWADELGWFILTGGGASIGGGGYTLDGTVGQPAASSLEGGDYNLAGGFWPALTAPIQLGISLVHNGALVTWTGTGYTLQRSPDATGPWTDFSSGTSADGSVFTAQIAVTQTRGFFRLRGNP